MKNPAVEYFLGVEWVDDQLRAGVFDDQWRLRGKASRTAKAERGMGEVLKRMARCALDAVDEADLRPEEISASAVLGEGNTMGSIWGPQQVNQFAGHLPPRLGSNLLTAGRIPTVMWSVHEYELFGIPRAWLGLFFEPAPGLFSADRLQRGSIKSFPPSLNGNGRGGNELTGDDVASGLAHDLFAAAHVAKPEVLLLIGTEYEDAEAADARRIRELLAAANLELPIHVPSFGALTGIWAAARLAARTFSARSGRVAGLVEKVALR